MSAGARVGSAKVELFAKDDKLAAATDHVVRPPAATYYPTTVDDRPGLTG